MYKEGKFYVIQIQDDNGNWKYAEALFHHNEHRARLQAIARKSGRQTGYTHRDYYDEYGSSEERDESINTSSNPYEVKMFSMDTDIKLIVSSMRTVRKRCGKEGYNPNSVRLVVIDSSATVYVPEDQSAEQVEMRKFALEKLSDAEKDLLKVTHWDVYHKLGDRSMLEDDDNENQ